MSAVCLCKTLGHVVVGWLRSLCFKCFKCFRVLLCVAWVFDLDWNTGNTLKKSTQVVFNELLYGCLLASSKDRTPNPCCCYAVAKVF